ncbi:lipopolysaccharide biosynthesis protein [Clostridium chrysemydis]|uniref:lipopolysaccharide biosynthesis protein n=1 Tax=Clostridium chrysemydis TaxID=2665504 RepID=UPI0018848287|nr:hypothetical protein [Clostridium chrysemydis]
MRVKNSLKNIYMNILTQVVIILLGFISRKVFLDNLGEEYLGVNGLLINLISMMSLVEGGIGLSIVYNLYKPLAEKDEEKIISLVQLYKKIYRILSFIIFGISLIIYPFLGYLMKDVTEVKYMGIVYFLFVFRNIVSYLNAHKWSLINADQKGYVLARYNLFFNIVTTIAKIIILVITKNYILYLMIELIIFIVQNVWIGKIVNSRYKYIVTDKKYEVSSDTKKNIIENVKALFLHNIGGWCVFGTDNILISAFISTKIVGLYSNYTMILDQVCSLINMFLNGVGESVGNLVAVESEEKKYTVFKVIFLVNFWFYSLAVIFLYNLIEPFINWWLGEGLLLGKLAFIFILINFYMKGLRASISMFKTKSGIFKNDKYVPLIESIINLGASIILLKYFGIAGVFMGTTISTVMLPFLIQPKLVYKYVFNKPVMGYFKRYIFFVLITLFSGFIATFLCQLIIGSGLLFLIIRGIVCLIIPNLIYICLFHKSDEFKYLLDIGKTFLKK